MAKANLGPLVLGGGLLLLLLAGGAAAAMPDDENGDRDPWLDPLPPLPAPDDMEQVIQSVCDCSVELEGFTGDIGGALLECVAADLFPGVPWPPIEGDHPSVSAWWEFLAAQVVLYLENADAYCAQLTPDEEQEYAPSDTVCFRDEQPYNAAQFPDPASVAQALIDLGFPIMVVELLASDKAAPVSPMWSASHPQGLVPKISQKLAEFQQAARELNLPGYAGSPASAVDGVIGECTIRSISGALELQAADQWPHGLPPAPSIQGF